ncbi:MAG TPA: sensor histidine kinase [Chitinophagaceae bacterium]|nr:sensor histidine kinase [Chitinophagaceae bacterium]
MELAAPIMRYFGCILLCVVLFTSCRQAPAPAEPTAEPVIDVSKVRFSNSMYDHLRYASVEHGSVPDSMLGKVAVDNPLSHNWGRHRVSPSIIEKELLLRIALFNPSDSLQRVYFYPGAYFSDIQLFRVLNFGSGVRKVSELDTEPEYRNGFRYLELQPGDSAVYLARLDFVRTSATMFYPAIVQKDYIKAFLAEKMQIRAKTSMFTYVASGIMLMMIFYSLAVFRLNNSREFLYYCGYAACLALLLFLKSFLLYDFTRFNYFFESYWDFLVQCMGVGCYFLFIRKFLNTKKNHPFIEKTFRIGQAVVLVFLTAYTYLFFFSNHFIWLNLLENITKQLLLVIGLVFIVYGWRRKKDKLLRYLVWGNILLLVFSLISFLMIVTPIQIAERASSWAFLNSAIIYYEIGLVAELTMFLSGLAYKNRIDIIERTREKERFRMDSERKELEKQMAILEAQQQERNRISADMHDELGSGVTAIRLMSEIVRSKMKDTTSLPEIDKISNSANDLITKMNTIIWTMTSANDTVENLITYIRTYALDFFESTNIECRFNLPNQIPHIQLSGEKRRNMFLAVKEALTNILKHSKASNVTIDASVTDKLSIFIQDDGVGVDFDTIRRFGNGMKNMKTRLDRIDGKFTIMNNGGTRIEFEMNL